MPQPWLQAMNEYSSNFTEFVMQALKPEPGSNWQGWPYADTRSGQCPAKEGSLMVRLQLSRCAAIRATKSGTPARQPRQVASAQAAERRLGARCRHSDKNVESEVVEEWPAAEPGHLPKSDEIPKIGPNMKQKKVKNRDVNSIKPLLINDMTQKTNSKTN